MLNFDFSIISIVVASWLLVSLIQLFYYLFFYLRIASKKQYVSDKLPPVSVIISARNEYENLKNFLPSVLEQDYSTYEVIVVNDASDDESYFYLESLNKKYNHLKHINIKRDDKFIRGKKLALTLGIKAAQYEYLLFTDADCKIMSNDWIRRMISSYNDETEIVLGYGGYIKKKGFLNKIIRFDTLFIAMQYFGFAKAGYAYMGVGRNLSYKKSLFLKNKGFASHINLISGDDDLFVNENATKKNIAVNTSAHTRSVPQNTFFSWVKQKKRHQTTFSRYKAKHKFLLSMEPLSRALFYALIPVILIIDFNILPFVAAIFGLRLLIIYLTFYFATKTLKEQDLLLFSPLLDFIFIFIDLIIIISKKTYN